MSLRIKLREATHQLHQDTEQLLFPDQSWQELSLDNYGQFLQTQFVFHSSIERAITSAISPSLKEQLQWPQRQKSGWIEADLEEINVLLPQHLPLPAELTSEAAALGMLYVTEGSMLGGRMIHKTLQQNEHIAPYSAFRFLEGYGEQTGALWKGFLHVLAQEVKEEEEESTAIAAAKQGFGIFAESVSFIQRATLA
ncbi:MAG: biliverdin-producing heme oxygenase [Cyclobacteriaceae bacterium]